MREKLATAIAKMREFESQAQGKELECEILREQLNDLQAVQVE